MTLIFFPYCGPIVRSLPEHTVDAWVAGAICSTFPHARIWAPTPRSLRSGWDQEAEQGEGVSFIFEIKATELVKPGNDHVIEINRSQLERYCALSEEPAQSPIFYVLPDPPWFSAPSQNTPVPGEATHRTGPTPFAAWTWVVSCSDLRGYLAGAHSIRTSTLAARGWPTLAGFLADAKESRVGRTSPRDAEPERPDVAEASSERELRSRDTLMAVFLPREDLLSGGGGAAAT